MPTGAADKLYDRVNHLFAETHKGGNDSARPWKAVHTLRTMGSRLVFEKALAWCSSPAPRKRMRAVAVLSQLRTPLKSGPSLGFRSEPVFRDESFAIIAEMLEHEQDVCALQSQIFAFGHLDNLAAAPLIKRFVDHPNEDIRYALAFSLGSLHEHPDAIAPLTKLADDSDKDVRNWAIFALGVIGDADSEELRQLFLAHLDDKFLDARIEAACALGKRRDARLAAPLIRMFQKDRALNGLIEAAKDLLEIDEKLPDWFENEYIAALKDRFPSETAS